jgi:hypothetical protein
MPSYIQLYIGNSVPKEQKCTGLIGAILVVPFATALCNNVDATIPFPLSAWSRPLPSTKELRIGKASSLTLRPPSAPRDLVSPGRADTPGQFGGIASTKIDKAGQFVDALNAPERVGIVRDRAARQPTGHRHGPD